MLRRLVFLRFSLYCPKTTWKMKFSFCTMFIAYALLACTVGLSTASPTPDVAAVSLESVGQVDLHALLRRNIGPVKLPRFSEPIAINDDTAKRLRRAVVRVLVSVEGKNVSKRTKSAIWKSVILRKQGVGRYTIDVNSGNLFWDIFFEIFLGTGRVVQRWI